MVSRENLTLRTRSYRVILRQKSGDPSLDSIMADFIHLDAAVDSGNENEHDLLQLMLWLPLTGDTCWIATDLVEGVFNYRARYFVH